MSAAAETGGKRVAWVELYLDLVFVLAVGQLAHLLVGDPRGRTLWIALGFFVVLWWTWIGFTVLYNRLGDDDPRQRFVYLAGSVPVGVAAVAIEPASMGHVAVWAGSLAVTRLVLIGAELLDGDLRSVLDRRITRGFATAFVLFTGSIWVPEPFRYVLWAVAVAVESGALLTDRRAPEPVPGDRLDSHHFAERFGLFLIILLGEVLVSAGQGALEGHDLSVGGWAALAAAMLMAGGLWWLYFDAVADVNLRVLELSGGSPATARAIFAAGHMIPCFALLLVAAGTALLLEGDPPQFAFHIVSLGLGLYLSGTRAPLAAASRRTARRGRAPGARIVLLVATFALGRLGTVLSPHEFLWLVAAWVALAATLSSLAAPAPEPEPA